MTTGPTGTSTTGLSTTGGPITGDPLAGTSDSSGSTTDTAKQQAAQVGQTAKEAGGQVASTAKEEARNVAGEARTQAKQLLGQTQTQVREQAGAQKTKAAGGLRGISDELRSLADGQPSIGGSGTLSGLAHQAADTIQEVAGWLESREPGDIVNEMRDFARRRPGAFLLGAAVAGVAAGRLTRGAVDASRDDSSGSVDAYAATPSYADTSYDLRTATPAATAGYATSDAGYAAPGAGGTRLGDDVFVEDAVVVETDPFGPRSERTISGGERL